MNEWFSYRLGFQKHIKEHHEDMRERPCPHPGCNKVFMIDRYLQRHVKLIHTGEVNRKEFGLFLERLPLATVLTGGRTITYSCILTVSV